MCSSCALHREIITDALSRVRALSTSAQDRRAHGHVQQVTECAHALVRGVYLGQVLECLRRRESEMTSQQHAEASRSMPFTAWFASALCEFASPRWRRRAPAWSDRPACCAAAYRRRGPRLVRHAGPHRNQPGPAVLSHVLRPARVVCVVQGHPWIAHRVLPIGLLWEWDLLPVERPCGRAVRRYRGLRWP